MKESTTPNSVPSLAAVSRASSENNDAETSLFETPRNAKPDPESIFDEITHSLFHDHDSVCGSDKTVASSSGLTSLGDPLTPFPAEACTENSVPGRGKRVSDLVQSFESSLSGGKLVFSPARDVSADVVPKKLADLFSIFDADPATPSECGSTVTPQASGSSLKAAELFNANCLLPRGDYWSPRVESLDRECSALKDIVRTDSANILKLKSELEKLRNENTRYKADLEVVVEELQQTRRSYDELKREKELQQEHEAEHLETIKILKAEVDNLTCSKEVKDSPASSEATLDPIEVRQLRLENEIFAAQILENEMELEKIRATLAEKDIDEAGIETQLNPLQVNEFTRQSESMEAEPERMGKDASLFLQLKVLTQRFDEEVQRRKMMEHQIDEIAGRVGSVSYEPHKFVTVTQDTEKIELQLRELSDSKRHSTEETGAKKRQQDANEDGTCTCDCDGWQAFSECLHR